MKKRMIMIISIVCISAGLLAGCGSKKTSDQAQEPAAAETAKEAGEEETQSPEETEDKEKTPVQEYTECASMEEAADIAGFGMTVPESAGSRPLQTIQAKDGIVRAFYYSESPEDASAVVITKSVLADTAADPTDPAESETFEAGEKTITLSGSEGVMTAAEWKDESFAYQIYSEGGLTQEEAVSMAEEML